MFLLNWLLGVLLKRSCIAYSGGPVCLESALILLALLIQAPVSAFLMLVSQCIIYEGKGLNVEVAGWDG